MVAAGSRSPARSAVGDLAAAVRAGRVGSLFNLWGREARARGAAGRGRGDPPRHPAVLRARRASTASAPSSRSRSPRPARSTRPLWEETARLAADEAAAAGLDLTFAPMLDVARDPRWGRIAEGPGEDPLVGARFAAAKVRGFQGDGLVRPRGDAPSISSPTAPAPPAATMRRSSLGAGARRGLPAAVPRRGRGRRRGDHAGLHRPRGRAADRAIAPLLRETAARATGASTAWS